MGASVRGGCSATPAREMRMRAERDWIRDEERKRPRKVQRVETPFDFMTVAELRTWAQKLDVLNYAKVKKDELAELVKTAYESGV